MKKEFIDYTFVFDKTFRLVPTYQHKNERSKPRNLWYQFQNEWIVFNQNLSLKETQKA
jgi:hypothetical protein